MLADLALCFLIFTANLVQTITGFAGTILVMPFAIMLKGADFSRSLFNLVGLLICIYIVVRERRSVEWRQLLFVVPVMVAGIAAGMLLYARIHPRWLLNLYGAFILAVALFNLYSKRRIELSRTGGAVALFAAGIVHAMFVSGGPLLALYVLVAVKGGAGIRATLCAIFTVTNFGMACQHWAAGYLTPELWRMLAYSIPAMCLGGWAGGMIFKRVDQKTFLRLSYMLLIVTSLYIFASNLM